MARSTPVEPISETELRLKALQFRKRGSSYRDIGTLLGVSTMSAYRLVQSALADLSAQLRETNQGMSDQSVDAILPNDTEEGRLAVGDRLMRNLPRLVETLLQSAQGEAQRIEETWQLAGLVMIGTGEDRRPAFPDLPPDQLVLTGQKILRTPADYKAAENILRSLLGTSFCG